MPKIFISYRHDDARHAAGRLALELCRHCRRSDIYFDMGGQRGVEFVKLYKTKAAEADVVLAVIGSSWNGDGRLDSEDSHVRQELLAARAHGVSVIPVLLDATSQPKKGEVPEALEFVFDIACEPLRHQSFEDDAGRLFRTAIELAEAKTSLPALSSFLQEMMYRQLNDLTKKRDRRDLSRLLPRVKLTTELAEQAERSALESQYRARAAADLADAAVRRSMQREVGAGTVEVKFKDDTVGQYTGDLDGRIKGGFGHLKYTRSSGDEIVYRGQWRGDLKSGFGEQVTTGADGSVHRYEGEWLDGKISGFGAQWIDKDCRIGEFRDGEQVGAGVYIWDDGKWFEGEWRENRRHGFGALWSKDGSLLKDGRWENGDHAGP